jgi:hypothetical protein
MRRRRKVAVRGSSQLLAGVRPYRLQRLLQSRSMTVTIFLGNMRWWKKRSKRIGCEKEYQKGRARGRGCGFVLRIESSTHFSRAMRMTKIITKHIAILER